MIWIERDAILGHKSSSVVILRRFNEEFFKLRVVRTFFEYEYFVKVANLASVEERRRIAYSTKKSDAFKRQPHSRIVWAYSDLDRVATRVEVETRGEETDNGHAFWLLNLLHSVASTGDLTVFRAVQKEERDRREKEQKEERDRRENDLRDREIKEAEKRRNALEKQRIRRCLEEDLCFRCEERVVQRRNRQTTELFFGCSQFGNRKCNATRRITCPECHNLMVEKARRKGGTFLGCSGWPKCNGGRDVGEGLELERWKARLREETSEPQYDPTVQTLDELAREWGWANWSEFDDSRE
jgi:ssDNA-binding Zn-finger/Zn-ribbon topoisomerase 1